MCGGPKFTEFQGKKATFVDNFRFQQVFVFTVDNLEAHNVYRVRHGAPCLDLSAKLCKYAEDHAKFLCQCDTEKTSKGSYGENIFIKRSTRKVYPDAYEPVMKWYCEIEQFDDTSSYPNKDIKHFTQVIWKETKIMGVGYAINE